MFSAPVGAWVTALVVLLLALFIVAIRCSLHTQVHAHAGWAWIVLPATYLVTGVVITIANGFFALLFLVDERLLISHHSCACVFLVWFVIGVVVSLLVIYVLLAVVLRMLRVFVRVLLVVFKLTAAFAPTAIYGLP